DPVLKRWIQADQLLRPLKSKYAFVWPKDSKQTSRSSTWSRFKDILKNEGPDIYITKNAHKLDYMENRPRAGKWGEWSHPAEDDGPYSFDPAKCAPWVQKGILGGRMPGLSYDFRTRRYGLRNKHTWSNVVWQPESWKYKNPDQVRDISGGWY
ncbi:hypothetical protein GQ44DRAFT_573467, partial [Phaeosphaeriaceae sp. PMI808]